MQKQVNKSKDRNVKVIELQRKGLESRKYELLSYKWFRNINTKDNGNNPGFENMKNLNYERGLKKRKSYNVDQKPVKWFPKGHNNDVLLKIESKSQNWNCFPEGVYKWI